MRARPAHHLSDAAPAKKKHCFLFIVPGNVTVRYTFPHPTTAKVASDRPAKNKNSSRVVFFSCRARLDLLGHDVTISASHMTTKILGQTRQRLHSGTRLFIFNSGCGRISAPCATKVERDNFRVGNSRRTGSESQIFEKLRHGPGVN